MTTSPRPAPQARDIPHTMAGDMQREDMSVDLAGCNVWLIALAMNEFERGKVFSMRFEGWPAEVQAIFNREVDAWQNRNSGIAIQACTTSVQNKGFMLALHWRPKAGASA